MFVFEKGHRPGVFTDLPIFLSSNPVAMTRSQPIEEILERMYEEITEKVDEFQRNGSGWVLREILNVDVLWCILAHLFPKYCNNVHKYCETDPQAYKEHEHEIVTKDLSFPLKISDIVKLERWNNLSINVFSIDKFTNLIPIGILDANVPIDRTD